MPGTMPSIDRDALTRLQAGDEQALRRIFDDHYSTLTHEAATVLEDPGGAPRVVETVFVRVWDERTEFESPEALESFLHKATREAAARAQSRRASLTDSSRMKGCTPTATRTARSQRRLAKRG